tara:strand:- start:1166 stop:1465 length:300 start_codon:yes stop_codon:yes gene_type:complete
MKDTTKKRWIIKGKGYYNTSITDLNGEPINDIEYGYDSVIFHGTKDELNDIIFEMQKNEMYFKIIDYFEDGSDEYYMFKYGPDYEANKNYKDELSRKIN